MADYTTFKETQDSVSEKTNQIQHEVKAYLDNVSGAQDKQWRYWRIRKALFYHYWDFYIRTLLSLKENNSLTEEEFEDLASSFKTVYHGALEQLRINLDETHLGLQMDQYTFNETEIKMSKKKSALFTNIAMKWNAMELGIKEDEFAKDISDIVDVRSLNRIKFVIELFEEYFLKQLVNEKDEEKMDDTVNYIDIVVKCLSNYDAIALLNDFDHVRGHQKEIKDLISTSFGNESDGHNVDEMMRKYRENEDDAGHDELDEISIKFQQFVDGLDLRERLLFETSVKIHSFLCQEVHGDGDELEQKEGGDFVGSKSKSRRSRGRTDATNSKFVNEMQSQKKSEKVEVKQMDELPEALRANGLSDVHCSQFQRILIVEQYDSEAIIHDLVDEDDRFNLYPDSNLFPVLQNNLYFTKITKKHFGAAPNDDDKIPPFTFGMERLEHVKYFEDRPGYIGLPKHSSLKDECLNNKIHPLPQEQFAKTLFTAYSLRMTKRGRTMRALDISWSNFIYEIPVNSPLSVSHIFVLLMYCNYTALQNKYKKFGCRERDSTQTLEELKQLNREIAHWHRLLFEVAIFFGQNVTPNQVFYTGLNIKLSFDTFAPLFNAPFSTTVSFDVANGFCGEDQNGLILKLQPADGSWDKYFDVEWLSDYPHEKERLFAAVLSLKISDIQYYEGQTLRKNTRYLRAFNLFSSLFSGHFIVNTLRLKMKRNQNRAWRVLLDLITVYNANNNIPNVHQDFIGLSICIPIYVQQLFYHLLSGFRRNKETNYLMKSQFDLLDDSLKSELMVIPEQDADDLQLEHIKLSPFMQSLCSPQQISFMQEYLWHIYGEKMEEVRRAKLGEDLYSDKFYLKIPDYGKVPLRLIVKRQQASGPMHIGFEWGWIPVKIDGRYSVAVDEVEYFLSNIKFWNSKNRQSMATFSSNLIGSVDTLTVKIAVHVFTSESS